MASLPSMDDLIMLIGLPVNDPTVQAFMDQYRPKQQPPTDPWERSLVDKSAGYDITYKRSRVGKSSRIVWAYVYVDPWQEFAGFQGQLMGGLVSTDGPTEVAAKLGPPTNFGVDTAGEYRWERRDSDLVCIHLAYNRESSRIRLFWLVLPEIAPHFG